MASSVSDNPLLAKLLGVGDAQMLPVWTPDQGFILVTYGTEGLGKSRFWMTASGIIVLFDFEKNLSETLNHMKQADPTLEERIVHHPYKVPDFYNRQAARREADRLLQDFEKTIQVVKNEQINFVFDSLTKLWELLRFAYVSSDDSGRANPREYAEANAKYTRLVTEPARNWGHRVFCTSRAKSVWIEVENNGRKSWQESGRFDADMQKETAYNASIILELLKHRVIEDGVFKPSRKYVIRKCTMNYDLVGQEFEESFDFETLAGLIEG